MPVDAELEEGLGRGVAVSPLGFEEFRELVQVTPGAHQTRTIVAVHGIWNAAAAHEALESHHGVGNRESFSDLDVGGLCREANKDQDVHLLRLRGRSVIRGLDVEGTSIVKSSVCEGC